MNNVILVAFITGLTAGGLSCFAVQGGLLSASIAQIIESVPRSKSGRGGRYQKKSYKARVARIPRAVLIRPILLFTLAKLAAYTVLGFLLGLLGSAFTFSPVLKGFIQIVIGVFLVGNALRMFNVHPIFRYFTFEPPAAVTRYIRRLSKRDDASITPLFLGAMTVLIPCGVTQSVMAIAIGSGNPWLGALIMFAFVLGTSPTFVGVSWLATNLGGVFQKYFYQVVAVIVLLLGLYTLDGGLGLAGSSVSVAGVIRESRSTESLAVVGNVARINARNNGYSPNRISLPADQPIELHLLTSRTRSCSRAIYIPDINVMQLLPESGDTIINIPAQSSGTKMQFMCTMGMYGGVLRFQ
jgi:sulfite exporter TauE/SafE